MVNAIDLLRNDFLLFNIPPPASHRYVAGFWWDWSILEMRMIGSVVLSHAKGVHRSCHGWRSVCGPIIPGNLVSNQGVQTWRWRSWRCTFLPIRSFGIN